MLTDIPLSVYGFVALTYIGFKFLVSFRYRPVDPDGVDDGFEPTVSIIVPEYNEDPDLFRRGLDSLLAQDYGALEEILVVDDGSDDTRAWEIAQAYAAENDLIDAARLDENQGKRHAQAHAFRRATGDLFVTIDSDTICKPDAVSQLVLPFHDTDVQATTGYPKVVNRSANLLTRLIDMRYWTAFNVERGAQSVFGTVICCCGVMSAYRRDLIEECLDDYLSQEFLGEECTFGDDRHLTAHALRRGQVLYQSTAVAETDAPETFRGYVTQQTRWMRSFWRESLLALRWAPKRSAVLAAFVVLDLFLPFALLTLGVGPVISYTSSTMDFAVAGSYFVVVCGIAMVRNAPYAKERKLTWLLSPLYAVIYLFALLPLNLYALSTMTSNGWGTR